MVALTGVLTGCSLFSADKAEKSTEFPDVATARSDARLCGVPAERRGYVVEPMVAADLRNRDHLVAAWQADRLERIGAGGLGVAVSTNGGASWGPRRLLAAPCDRAYTDPAVALTGSTGYLAFINFPRKEKGEATVEVSRFGLGQPTFGDPVELDAHNTVDKPALAVDPQDEDTLHVAWIRREGGELGPAVVMFASTRDGGKHWSRPVSIGPVPRSQAQGTQLTAFDSRHLLITYSTPEPNGGPAFVVVVRSDDGGRSWARAAPAATMSRYQVTLDDQVLRTADFFPAVAGDKSGYAVLALQRNAGGLGRVLLAESWDYGATWTETYEVVRARAQIFNPAVTVAPDHQLGLVWHQLVAGHVSEWFGSSGISRQVPVTIGTGRQIVGPRQLRGLPNRNLFLGDYDGLTAARDQFVAAMAVPSSTGNNPTEILAGPLTLK